MPCCYLLVIGRDGNRVRDFLGDDFSHSPNPLQVGENVVFTFFIVDPLAVYENFHDALTPRGDGHGHIGSVVAEELVRHPRGGTEVLSRNAVGNLDLDFSFHASNSLMVKLNLP